MQKFSDVSSLSANKLRTLFESELLQLHSKISNQAEFEKIICNNYFRQISNMF